MESTTIQIHVSPEAARVYESASAEERRKLDLLLDLKLTEASHEPARSLEEIMSDIGREAQQRGLTPDILERILNEP